MYFTLQLVFCAVLQSFRCLLSSRCGWIFTLVPLWNSVTAASVFLFRIPIFFQTFKVFSNPVTPRTQNESKIHCGFEIYCITALVYCFRIPLDGAIILILGF